MATTAVTVAEYLSTTYHPDREYVDGMVLERNVGEYGHGKLQLLIGMRLSALQPSLGIDVTIETRVQVSASRFRIPDVCVLRAGAPREQIIRTPPLLCIEVLSPDDRVSDIEEKVDDYLRMGVDWVCVINPRNWHTHTYSSRGVDFNTDGIIRITDPAIELRARDLLN